MIDGSVCRPDANRGMQPRNRPAADASASTAPSASPGAAVLAFMLRAPRYNASAAILRRRQRDTAT